jgi:diguanylate cyclase (GGDEF)-like protein
MNMPMKRSRIVTVLVAWQLSILVAIPPASGDDGLQRTEGLVARFLAAEPLDDNDLSQLRQDVRQVLQPLSKHYKPTESGPRTIEAQTFSVGILIGALLLVFGWLLGFWSRNRGLKPTAASLLSDQVVTVLGDLYHCTKGLASEVAQYRKFVEGVAIDAGNPDPGTDPKVHDDSFIHKILAANRDLQNRLDTAETTLKSQADSIVTFLSEARTDPLTRLPNRRAFDDEMARNLAAWKRHGRPCSILVADIDHFKQVNDRYGHQVGDLVLATVARKLKESCRGSDLAVRLGGEEFAIVLPQAEASEAIQAAERFRRVIEQTEIPHDGRMLRVTMSVGTAQLAGGESTNSMVQRADAALYASKKAGRNNSHLHDGQRCAPIDKSTPAAAACSLHPLTTVGVVSASALSNNPLTSHDPTSLDVPPQLHEVCHALRERLSEFAEGSATVTT